MRSSSSALTLKTFGKITPQKAYDFIEGVRDAFHVSALGFGTTGQITEESSLLTSVTVEGFSSVLNLLVFGHECYNLATNPVFKNDTQAPHRITQHSLYLSFRLTCILSSIIGATLIAHGMVNDSAVETTVGTLLVSLGIFGSHILNSSKPKEVTIINQSKESEEEFRRQRSIIPIIQDEDHEEDQHKQRTKLR
jgi:hypothetical protein